MTDQPRQVPTYSEQKETIKQLMNDFYDVGSLWNLISPTWWNIWKKVVQYEEETAGSQTDITLPPIDNSDLLDNDGQLKPKLMSGEQYVLVPDGAWKLLVQWYGGGPPIQRKMIEVGEKKETWVEVYPLTLNIVRLNNISKIQMSKAAKVVELQHKVAGVLYQPPFRMILRFNNRDATWKKLEKSMFQKTLDEVGILDDSYLHGAISEDEIPPKGNSDIEEEGPNQVKYMEMTNYSSNNNNNQQSDSSDEQMKDKEKSDETSSDDIDGTKIQTFDQNDRNSVRGVCGLRNLGNTCFMNSALQCLSNSGPLTTYFLEGRFKGEINRKNPLGMGGKMAEEYSKLMEQMWKGKYDSVAPSDFKWIVGRMVPRFSGYSQQDSQELVAFVLDGLHEDLNRIETKPYVEALDSDGTNDVAASEEAWRRHQLRNKSVVVDLFQGQLKSKLVCPEDNCKNVSVAFDPFMYLSVPIPTNTKTFIDLIFVPLDVNTPLKQYSLKLDVNDKISVLKEKLSEVVKVKPEDIVLTDITRHSIYKIFSDKESVGGIRRNDDLYAYQIVKSNDQNPNILNIQVVNRVKSNSNTKYLQYDLVGIPFVISIPYHDKFNAKDLLKIMEDRIKIHNASPSDTPMEQVFTFSKIKQSHSTGKDLNYNDDTPIKIKDKNTFAINWSSKEYYNKSYDKVIEKVKNYEVEQKKSITLNDCLDLFVQEEKLSKENQWYCPKCKNFRQATKKFDLWKSPELLVVHLKRFQGGRFMSAFGKIDSFIDYPITGLDLSDYVKCEQQVNEQPPIYDLYAVSIHSGGLGGGHYTAYAKNFVDGKWYSFNDSHVSPTNISSVVTSGAYLLFYQRRK